MLDPWELCRASSRHTLGSGVHGAEHPRRVDMTCAACCPEAPRALRLAYPCADAVPLYGGRWSGYLRPRTPLRSQVSGLSHVRVMLFAARLDGLHTRLLSKRIADTDNDGAVLDDIDELISDAVASSSVERIDTLSKVCLPFLTALLSFAIDDPSKGEHLDRISSLVSRLSSSQGRSRTRSWSYSFGNVELHDADICDADLGSQTWESGVILARLIDEATVPVGGRVVLELGSGTGLAGIVASKRNARRIVMTDYHDGVIANIRHNLSLNGLTITDAVDVVAVDWRCPPALPDDFTVIVAADFCYDREAAGLVWACVAKYLSATDEGARFHAVVPFRPGFADEVAAFEALAPVNGFVLESSADVDAERMRHRYYVYKRGGKD